MKIINLLFIAIFGMSTWVSATEPVALSLQTQERVRQLSQQMSEEGIPEAQAKNMLTLMHQNSYQERNIIQAQQTVMDAATQNLPTEPVMNKAMEGMAKQVPQESVIAAMETVRNRYSYAYRLAKSLSDDTKNIKTIGQAIADSLAAGMAEREMDGIMTRLRTQTHQQTRNQDENLSLQTMLTVRSMMRLGAMSSNVSDTIGQALQHRYTARNMEHMRYRFSEEAQYTPVKQLEKQYANSIGKSNSSSNIGSNEKGSDGSSGSGSSGSGSGGSGGGGSGSGGSGGGGSGGGGSGGGGSGGGGRK